MFNFKLSTLATLFCTAALVSQSVVGRSVPYRRSVQVYKRAQQVETLDGSPVDRKSYFDCGALPFIEPLPLRCLVALIVDFLDQVDYFKNEADNGEYPCTWL